MSSPPRSQLVRSPTWPSAVSMATHGQHKHVPESSSLSTAANPKPDCHMSPEEDVEDHPEDYFLSPMHEYEEWLSDSDEDDEEFEWDAGITDFALFDSDRRRAEETDGQLSGRWDHFMASQRSALHRALERTRAEEEIDTTKPPLPVGQVPSLTPDSSPNLRDDLDSDSDPEHDALKSSVPNYLTVTITPPSPEERAFDDDDDLPLFLKFQPSKKLRHEVRKLQRPGLRYARTMSGKIHSWKRPSWHIYSVGEEPEAERKAELGIKCDREACYGRGRQPDR